MGSQLEELAKAIAQVGQQSGPAQQALASTQQKAGQISVSLPDDESGWARAIRTDLYAAAQAAKDALGALEEFGKTSDAFARRLVDGAGGGMGGAVGKHASSGRTIIMEPNDPFVTNADKASPAPGFHDVVAHGDATSFATTPSGAAFDAQEMARRLRASSTYQGGPIRLLSCSTGSTPNGAAQQLADALGVDVLAPTDTLWAFPSGRLLVSSNGYLPNGGFKLFKPKGNG